MSKSITENIKKISITEKRQLTIPKAFYEQLNFGNEAECIIKDNALIIKPIKNDTNYFAEQILTDLIKQGYSGNELLEKFKEIQSNIKPAVQKILNEAELAAQGKGEYYTNDDIFGA